jgi:hypothetical protein
LLPNDPNGLAGKLLGTSAQGVQLLVERGGAGVHTRHRQLTATVELLGNRRELQYQLFECLGADVIHFNPLVCRLLAT